METPFDADALRALSPAQRQELMRELVTLEGQSTRALRAGWKWDAVLVLIVAACVILAAWTGYLAVSLPSFYRAGSWRGAWVGFDIALLAAFAAAGWAAWRRRQVLIISLAVLATLLICDAWFDVVLDVRTHGFQEALASALVIELPLAVLAIMMTRRLLYLTFARVLQLEGLSGKVPPLWKIPLMVPGSGTPRHWLKQARAQHKADTAAGRSDDRAA